MIFMQIIKGNFTPLPTSRSKELRDLVACMLTLDVNKRPSINQLLAMPVLKQRITAFLSRTLEVRCGLKQQQGRL